MNEDLIPEYYKNFLAKPNEDLFEHTRLLLECLEEFKKYLSDSEFELLKYCCIYHDIGKLNPLFQKRVNSDNKLKFDPKKEVGHNILSFLYVFNNMSYIPINEEYKNLLFNIILNHHHYVNNISMIGREDNLEISNYICAFNTQKCSIPTKRIKKEIDKILHKPTIRQAVLKGFFHKCDYAASAHIDAEIDNDGLTDRLYNKGYKWNDMQEFAKNNSGKNIIIVGSTGLGKTEASLLWQGEGKSFYVLPVRTAINAMYRRIVNDFYQSDYKQQVGLLHSETKNIYLKDESIQDVDSFWEYFELTRNRALPLTVCTPDQIFRFVFKYPGYETDLATFSYSGIIIDEIQAYSPDLLAVLIYGLQMINKAGGKFAITTATLPPIIREWIDFENDENGNKVERKIDLVEHQFLKSEIRHKVNIIEDYLDAKSVIDFYEKNNGKESLKILVVVNTVTSAQSLYTRISAELGVDKVKLLHSKFIVKDRKKLEKEIIEDGKTENCKHIIWIATQVVEASLDIDFDFLFTEFSELSGLFQRMGRCNRKGLKSISEQSNVYIYEKIEAGLLCRKKASIGSGKNGFIYNSLYQLGREALHKWKEDNFSDEMSEFDKVNMINGFYTKERISEAEKSHSYSSYINDYYDRYDKISNISTLDIQDSKLQDSFRNIVSTNAIPYNIYINEKDMFDAIESEIVLKRERIKNSEDHILREKLKVEILELKDRINEFTLSVEPYKVDLKNFVLNNWEKVYVVKDDYVYDREIGLHKSNREDCEAIFW